jgi:hypothetical protein
VRSDLRVNQHLNHALAPNGIESGLDDLRILGHVPSQKFGRNELLVRSDIRVP